MEVKCCACEWSMAPVGGKKNAAQLKPFKNHFRKQKNCIGTVSIAGFRIAGAVGVQPSELGAVIEDQCDTPTQTLQRSR